MERAPTLTVASVALSVSELASQAGISSDAVRYYGRLGLLPETGRTDAGHRYYDEAALDRLRFIKGAQWLELRLDEIRDLLEVVEGDVCPCRRTREVILGRIAAIDEQRDRLNEIRTALLGLLGDDTDAVGESSNGHTNRGENMTTARLAAPPTAENPGCGCCVKPPPSSVPDEVRELQARREAVERRLAGLRSGQRPS